IRRDLAALEAERAASLAQIQQQTALSNKLIEQQMQKHELQRQQELALIQQRYDEEKRRLEQEAESRLMGLRQENEQRQQQHANNISDLQLQAEFRKTLVKNADMALGNLANDVGSAESFVRAGNAVAQTFSQIIQTAGSANALPGAGVPPLALSAADSGNLSPLLNEAFEQIAQLTCDPHEKKHLRAAILHLSAELSLGEEADAGIVSHYGEQIKTLTDKLKGTLSREQFDFLCDIQQTERLKKFLKQG
ncbi:MAG: hypothetical protein ACREEM_52230, partial [Blastocatellia bacterium]